MSADLKMDAQKSIDNAIAKMKSLVAELKALTSTVTRMKADGGKHPNLVALQVQLLDGVVRYKELKVAIAVAEATLADVCITEHYGDPVKIADAQEWLKTDLDTVSRLITD